MFGIVDFSSVFAKEPFVWEALRSCGLKKQITWEDAVDEAQHIADSCDHRLSKLLFKHLEQNHQKMEGDKGECMKALQKLKWILAHPPQSAGLELPEASRSAALRSLSDLFSASEFELVWAVESTLHTDLVKSGVPTLLKARRSVKSEPAVLVSQLEACAKAAK